MAMKATIKQEGRITIVNLEGKTEYQSSRVLRNRLQKIYRNQDLAHVIINFNNLDFVGSSGIRIFIETLKAINKTYPKETSFCGLKTEFKKIIGVTENLESFRFFETESEAKNSVENTATNTVENTDVIEWPEAA